MSGRGAFLTVEVDAVTDYEALVRQLESADTKRPAMMALRAAREDAKPALLKGLAHPAWRVRHGVLRVLDHAIVDDATRLHVVAALKDPHRKVRQAALHLLGCEACKPDGFCGIEGVDIDGVYVDMVNSDRSRRVRRAAMVRFMWHGEPLEQRVVDAATAALVREDDELRTRAARILAYPAAHSLELSPAERRARYEEEVNALLVSADREV